MDCGRIGKVSVVHVKLSHIVPLFFLSPSSICNVRCRCSGLASRPREKSTFKLFFDANRHDDGPIFAAACQLKANTRLHPADREWKKKKKVTPVRLPDVSCLLLLRVCIDLASRDTRGRARSIAARVTASSRRKFALDGASRMKIDWVTRFCKNKILKLWHVREDVNIYRWPKSQLVMTSFKNISPIQGNGGSAEVSSYAAQCVTRKPRSQYWSICY